MDPLDMLDEPMPIPICELGGEFECKQCKCRLDDEAYYDEWCGYYCEACFQALIDREKREARNLASKECRITTQPNPYDPTCEFRPTPDEYAAGWKEAHTPNSHVALTRHNCTNYDELIKGYTKTSYIHRIYYLAIRSRIDELVAEAVDAADNELEA